MTTHDDRDKFLHQYGDKLIDQGFGNPYNMSIENKDKLFKQIIKQLIFFRESSEINQFQKGMNEVCQFWDVVVENAQAFKDAFCTSPTPFTKDSFLALCKTTFSEVGSNRRREEQDTQYAWEMFLLDIEEKCVDVCFSELLVFITGADKPPCRGFQQKISIAFYDQEPGVKRNPFSSTCSLQLSLPRNIQDSDILKELMLTALKDSYGF
ncbi:uncharacterized protein LOC117319187, partial [Pecten maximus]|uniref:uncharacterized protein LOC117319187 n=1 Tax=Pecten maximus TaxID=6579 RepID=UPI001458EF83